VNRKRKVTHDPTREHVTGQRGRTDGAYKQSAVSARKPQLRRRKPRDTQPVSAIDPKRVIEALEAGATVSAVQRGEGRYRADMLTYRGTLSDADTVGSSSNEYRPNGGHNLGTSDPKGIPQSDNVRDAISHVENERKRAENEREKDEKHTGGRFRLVPRYNRETSYDPPQAPKNDGAWFDPETYR
jgi:hypothetical protein